MTKKTEYWIILSWLLISLPLIIFSYGSDGDAGRLAEAASKIWEYHEYFKSRTTGFPLYEIAISPLVTYGQWYLSNLLSVGFGLLLLMALLKLWKLQEFKHPLLVILGIAFAPIIIKNSTSTMDYMGALALLTWSYTYMRQDRYFLAAVLVGLASGFRPVSGLFIIPIMIYVWSNKKDMMYIGKIYITALVVGTISYLPALLTYGIPHSAYIPHDLKATIMAGGYYFLAFFGIAASIVIYPTLIHIVYTRRKVLTSFDLFHLSNIILWMAMFIYLPYEPEYLLPMLFSIILVLDRYLNFKTFLFIVILILSYHVIKFDLLAGKSGERHIHPSIKLGYTISDIRHRIFQHSLRNIATNFHVTKPTILTFGYDSIPNANHQWSLDKHFGLPKREDGLLYLTGSDTSCNKYWQLHLNDFEIIVWNDLKSEISKCPNWKNYTTQVDDLSAYFGATVSGKSLTSE